MHLENLDAALLRRAADADMPVEAPGAEQGRIENVGAIRRSQHDDKVGLGEAIHLAKNLVERLLALVMPAAQPRATLATHRVDFIDEDDRRRVFLGRAKQVAHPAGADADEHLDELRTT